MDKQKNMLLEVAALVTVIGGIWFLLWNLNFYPSTKKATPPTAESSSQHTSASGPDDNIEKGRLLYRSYCRSCHYPTVDGLGPPLAGATRRWHDAGSYQGKTGDQWLKIWVKNWKDAVAAGYPYAVTMAQSRENEMNYFTNLTDAQIDLILNYVDDPRALSQNPH